MGKKARNEDRDRLWQGKREGRSTCNAIHSFGGGNEMKREGAGKVKNVGGAAYTAKAGGR